MADEDLTDEDDENSGENRKRRSLVPIGSLIKILMYLVGFIIFVSLMVVVSVITNRIMSRGSGSGSANLDNVTDIFNPANEIFDYYSDLEQIRTSSADASQRSITVTVRLGYSGARYPELSAELAKRDPQIMDMLRNYFSKKYAAELSPDNDTRIKTEIENMINELLQNGRIEEVVFPTMSILDF